MGVTLAAVVALLLPACCLSLGQLSSRGQQSVWDAEGPSELYKDFDADVQALLRGGTSESGDPLLNDAAADILEEPSRMQQDSHLPAPMPPLELAAVANAEAPLATDLVPEPAVDAAPLAEASPTAPDAGVTLPPEDGAGLAVPEQAALPEAATEPLADPSSGEAPPAVALEALPLVPGLPAQEQRTAALVQTYDTGPATGVNKEAPPNLDDVLARTEKIAAVLAEDSTKLALHLGELKRKLKADRASVQRTLATEAAGSSDKGPYKGMKNEKSGSGWIQKSAVSGPIIMLNLFLVLLHSCQPAGALSRVA